MTFKELKFTETVNYAQTLLRKADEWESCYVTFNVGDVKVQCTEARKKYRVTVGVGCAGGRTP